MQKNTAQIRVHKRRSIEYGVPTRYHDFVTSLNYNLATILTLRIFPNLLADQINIRC